MKKFQPTRDDRGWVIDPFGSNPWWTSLAAALPALLAVILIFMDQQITAVIVNRKENKLKVKIQTDNFVYNYHQNFENYPETCRFCDSIQNTDRICVQLQSNEQFLNMPFSTFMCLSK